MKRYIMGFLLISLVLVQSSCVPTRKMIYLQSESEYRSDQLFEYSKSEYKLQCNDIIAVKITSPIQEVNNLFNAQNSGNQSVQAGVQSGGDLYYMTGYSIDDEGFVILPILGKINLKGLTLNQAFLTIDSVASMSLKSYFLDVKLGGIRFSGLGEFNNPGKKVILQNQATILEAIAACGDLTALSNRGELKLIRQYPEGTRIHSINLLSEDLITQEFYFIQPNDVLYAEPLPRKAWGLGVTGSQTLSSLTGVLNTSFAVVLSIISLTR